MALGLQATIRRLRFEKFEVHLQPFDGPRASQRRVGLVRFEVLRDQLHAKVKDPNREPSALKQQAGQQSMALHPRHLKASGDISLP